jgi:GWxTD domain-containing protein
MRLKSSLLFCCAFTSLLVPAFAQDAGPDKNGADKSADKTPDKKKDKTVAKPMTDKQRRQQQERLRKELETPYKKWLSEDVGYIISDEERKAFKVLQTDEERDQFIEQFWLRRDPTPDTEENEYREEHYRRIAYANEHYASGIPGWKSDRGMIYIKYGPADETDVHNGGTETRSFQEGGGTTSMYPYEDWRYRYIEGIGSNVEIEFVDTTLSGEFRMTMDPSEKDALLNVPGAGLTTCEQMGQCDKSQRFSRTDGTHLGLDPSLPVSADMNEFTRLEKFSKLQAPPSVKFKDLEAAVNSTIKYNLLPMKVRADFIPVTGNSVLSNITIQFDRKDLQFKQRGGVASATVNLYARITSLSRRPVNWFEDTVSVEVPSDLLQQAVQGQSIYQKSVPLQPGRYRLNVAAKDLVGGNTTNFEMALEVPRIEDDKLGQSSLILADILEKVATRNIGTGQFVIGTSKVRPRVDDTFRRDEKLGIYLQLYNFQADATTKKPNGTVEYVITKTGSDEKIFEFSEEISTLSRASSQVVIEKLLPLQSLQPGSYTLKMRVVDKTRNQTLTPSATFTVT